jgi:MarR family transcriptional regulator, organic hydroperoxide resistance regulator
VSAEAPPPRLDDLIDAERDIVDRLASLDVDVDFEALSLVSNVYRAASAIRRHMEQQVLAPERLSWTAFVTLWVLWIWGEMESRHLAAEANVTKGTLTGVLDTLERRGLVARRRRTSDRRLVMVSLTDEGRATIRDVFPRFNHEEARIAALLSATQRHDVAGGMRRIVRGLADPPSG